MLTAYILAVYLYMPKPFGRFWCAWLGLYLFNPETKTKKTIWKWKEV